jgi:predicted alpha/beta-fold hydrolase
MSEDLDFKPFPLLSNPHFQTVVGSYLNFDLAPLSETHKVLLNDGDKISLEITTPHGWKETDPTVMLVHGLCGSHKSGYLVRMARKLYERGIKAVRFNMRGCGSGKGEAKEIYHSGRSDDVLDALKYVKNKHKETPITLIGFSLGGNIVLKLAGELNVNASKYLDQVIAVCPPIHLQKSVMRLDHCMNRFYKRYFLKNLATDLKIRHALFPHLELPDFPKDLSFYDFDEIYVAPQSGFKSAVDYYTKCSSSQFIPHITVPCRILFAKDDPIVYTADVKDVYTPSNVLLYSTDRGGHMGFLGRPFMKRGLHWMDHLLIEWIEDR